MVIFLICFYAMSLWINALSYHLGSAGFVLLIFLPLLPAIPIAIWCFITKHASASLHLTQQLLRANAGPDELIVRELEKHHTSHSESNDSG